MKELEVGDNEQVHAAFLVYMDLSEGELESAACGLLGLTVCLYADDTDFYLAFINYSLTGCIFYSSNI